MIYYMLDIAADFGIMEDNEQKNILKFSTKALD
jgi:hypothetical protein